MTLNGFLYAKQIFPKSIFIFCEHVSLETTPQIENVPEEVENVPEEVENDRQSDIHSDDLGDNELSNQSDDPDNTNAQLNPGVVDVNMFMTLDPQDIQYKKKNERSLILDQANFEVSIGVSDFII